MTLKSVAITYHQIIITIAIITTTTTIIIIMTLMIITNDKYLGFKITSIYYLTASQYTPLGYTLRSKLKEPAAFQT